MLQRHMAIAEPLSNPRVLSKTSHSKQKPTANLQQSQKHQAKYLNHPLSNREFDFKNSKIRSNYKYNLSIALRKKNRHKHNSA